MTFDSSNDASAVTAALSELVAKLSFDDLTPEALTVARHCLLDWFGVALAASHAPLVQMLVDQAEEDGGKPVATLVGRPMRVSLEQAALINGTAAHTLDYDDVHFAMQGHPSAPIAAAALAMAEHVGASGARLIQGFAAGFELACRVGLLMGSSHYLHGWHATATFGAFGAAGACANLLRLDPVRTAHALGIAGSQAAGLKCVFGTMTKPHQAGRAAAIGVQAARLAARGFTSSTAILDAEQGFATTQSTTLDPAAALATPEGGFHLPRNMFKYHAACYLTHSSIEAAAALRRTAGFDPARIARVAVTVDQDHLRVCNIPSPTTGLEMKFSLRASVAMALLGYDTARGESFSDTVANDPALVALRDKIAIEARPTFGHTVSDVIVELVDGTSMRETCDVAVPAADLAAQEEKLVRKFISLAAPRLSQPVAESFATSCMTIEKADNLSALFATISHPLFAEVANG